jgi:hypothetical protein
VAAMTDLLDLIRVVKDLNDLTARAFEGTFDLIADLGNVADRHEKKILELQDRLTKLEGR